MAGIGDAEQYRQATQRKSSRNLLKVFRSLWLETTQGDSIKLSKEEMLGYYCRMKKSQCSRRAGRHFVCTSQIGEDKNPISGKKKVMHPKFIKFILRKYFKKQH